MTEFINREIKNLDVSRFKILIDKYQIWTCPDFYFQLKSQNKTSRKCSAWKDFRFKPLSFQFPHRGKGLSVVGWGENKFCS